MDIYDVAVIGGGAAGLCAALVLARARRDVVVVDAGRPRNAPAAHMHGYLGSDGMPPSRLLAAGRQEVAGYGGHLLEGEVADVRPVTDLRSELADAAVAPLAFSVTLTDESVLRARRVLVTTGLRDDVPDIPGVRERWGRDLLHCPYCHGHEVRDQALGVLGGSAEAVAHAQIVRQWSGDVMFFSDGQTLTSDQREALVARAVRIVDEPVRRLVVHDDRLTGVELASGQLVPRTAVFVRPQFRPNDALLAGLGCATHPNGWVVTDPRGAPASGECGPRATPSTRERRSSPRQARGRPPPSRSTTTWSRRRSRRRCPASGSAHPEHPPQQPPERLTPRPTARPTAHRHPDRQGAHHVRCPTAAPASRRRANTSSPSLSHRSPSPSSSTS